MKKCTPLWRAAHFEVNSQKCKKQTGAEHFWTFRCRFGAKDCASCQMWTKRDGFVAVSKVLAGVGHLKKICKDAFRVACAVQETCYMFVMLGGPGANFVRGGAFWSIRSSGLVRWFSVTGAPLRMIWPHFFVAGTVLQTDGAEKSQNALVRGRQLCTQLSIFEGSPQNCFVFAEFLSFWRCQVQNLRKSRRFFLTSSTSNIEEVS